MSPHDFALVVHVRHLVHDHGVRPFDVAQRLGLDAGTLRWALTVDLDADVYDVGWRGQLKTRHEHAQARPA